jgi:hypothetical protein
VRRTQHEPDRHVLFAGQLVAQLMVPPQPSSSAVPHWPG